MSGSRVYSAPAGWVQLLLVVLAASCFGCNGGDQPNAADHRFVAQTIAHHELGVQLIELATTDAHDVRLRRMVFEQGTYHGHELDQLHTWARDWKIELPAGAGFPGDVSGQLAELSQSTGAEFDELWLQTMIEHHEGFVTLHGELEAEGSLFELGAFADATLFIQRSQLAGMKALLAEW